MRLADAAERVDADQQLHQIVVCRVAGRLDHEHILAADVLVDLDEDFLIGETAHALACVRGISRYSEIEWDSGKSPFPVNNF